MMDKSDRILFGTAMLLIIILGLAGNTITIVVLFQREHRRRAITPLMINLAAANVLICLLGYPQSFSLSIVGQERNVFAEVSNRHLCEWTAFINATCGFGAIISLSFMSVMTYKRVTRLRLRKKGKSWVVSVVLVWFLSISLAAPPFFGWNRFIPMESGVSCHPDWISQVAADVSYIIFLVVCGFVVPLCIICYSFTMVYR